MAVAAEAGELVGCYPLLGRMFLLERGPTLAVFGADLAVRPEHRTAGTLHRRLSELAESMARRRDAAFAYGFPNPDALRVSKRFFGLRDWVTLECWSFRARAWRGPATQDAVPAAETTASLRPGIWPTATALAGAGLRDPAFLSWRFGERTRYRLRRGDGEAYLVVYDGADESIVCDYAPALDAGTLRILLEEELRMRLPGRRRLIVHATPESAMAEACRAAGFRRAPQRDKPVTVKPLEGQAPSRPAHLTLADGDDP
jgi:hypothetical protein